MKNWNGRFQGVGGGGFSGGSAGGVAQPLRAGYAAGSTDTGHEGGSGSFALDARGRLNWQAIRNNAYLGIHEMTVTGKALTQAFYGTPPQRAYFNGCSTGGRQGLSEAQRYPGRLRRHPRRRARDQLDEAARRAAVGHGRHARLEHGRRVVQVRGRDGRGGGRVRRARRRERRRDRGPDACTYDPRQLVGAPAGDCGAITDADAAVVRADLGRPAPARRVVPLVRARARRRFQRPQRHRRHAARAPAERDHGRLVALLPQRRSAVDWPASPAPPTSSPSTDPPSSSAPSSRPTSPISPGSARAAERSSCGTAGPIR